MAHEQHETFVRAVRTAKLTDLSEKQQANLQEYEQHLIDAALQNDRETVRGILIERVGLQGLNVGLLVISLFAEFSQQRQQNGT